MITLRSDNGIALDSDTFDGFALGSDNFNGFALCSDDGITLCSDNGIALGSDNFDGFALGSDNFYGFLVQRTPSVVPPTIKTTSQKIHHTTIKVFLSSLFNVSSISLSLPPLLSS